MPSETPPLPPARRSLFPLLAASVFVEALSVGMLFPLLARIQAAHHLPTYGLGLMSGANFFSAVVTQLAVVRLLDGHRRRAVMLGGLALGAVSLLWFAESSSLLELTTSRALGGISYAIVMPAALRAATVGVPEAQRGGRLGRLSSVQMAGIVLGPLAGTALAAAGDLRTPWLAVGAVSAAISLAMSVTPVPAVAAPAESEVPAVPPGGAIGAPPAAGDSEPAVDRPRPTSRPVIALLLLSAASQLPNGLYDALWSRLLTDRGADSFLIGLSLTAFGIPFVLLAPLGGRFAARRSPLVVAGAGLCVAALFMASYGFVESPIVIIVLGMFEACAQAVVIPGGYAAAARVFPDRWAASGQGWYSSAGTGAAGASAVAGAPAYAWIGPGPVFAGGAALSIGLVAASLATAYGRPPEKQYRNEDDTIGPGWHPSVAAVPGDDVRGPVASEDAREPG